MQPMAMTIFLLCMTILILCAVIVFLVGVLNMTVKDIRQNYTAVEVPPVDWDYTKEYGWREDGDDDYEIE